MLPKISPAVSDGAALDLDNAAPINQNNRLGARLQQLELGSLHVQKVTVAADATGGQAFVAEVAGELVDMWVVCTSSNASGTLTLRRVTTAMSSAVVCATISVPSRTALVVQAQKAVVQGEALNLIANGASDKGIAYIAILRS